MASGVYKIQSISHPDRVYIGSAVNLSGRWSKHRKDLRNNDHHSPKLQNHYNKYGGSDLVYSVLMECPVEDVIVKEQCYFNIYKPWFNISPTAGSSRGIKRTEEFRAKVKSSHVDVSGENNPFFGKTHTEESNEKRRRWNLEHDIKPPTYHGGRKKGFKNK